MSMPGASANRTMGSQAGLLQDQTVQMKCPASRLPDVIQEFAGFPVAFFHRHNTGMESSSGRVYQNVLATPRMLNDLSRYVWQLKVLGDKHADKPGWFQERFANSDHTFRGELPTFISKQSFEKHWMFGGICVDGYNQGESDEIHGDRELTLAFCLNTYLANSWHGLGEHGQSIGVHTPLEMTVSGGFDASFNYAIGDLETVKITDPVPGEDLIVTRSTANEIDRKAAKLLRTWYTDAHIMASKDERIVKKRERLRNAYLVVEPYIGRQKAQHQRMVAKHYKFTNFFEESELYLEDQDDRFTHDTIVEVLENGEPIFARKMPHAVYRIATTREPQDSGIESKKKNILERALDQVKQSRGPLQVN